ncbi:MAG TPA: YfiR family protein [Bacteroidales bacterium]|nr:YfiR family protein [Bacteroidales bacterium]
MRKRIFTLVFTLFSVCLVNGYSQITNVNQAQSLYIYNFSRLIQWPAGNQSGDFVIGVIGNDELYNSLITYVSNKKVGSQPIVIRKFDNPESLTRCHIIFVGNSKVSAFEDVLLRCQGSNSLIITEKKGMVNFGSAIDFFMDQNKLKFMINSMNAQKYNLTVSKSLEDMAYRN